MPSLFGLKVGFPTVDRFIIVAYCHIVNDKTPTRSAFLDLNSRFAKIREEQGLSQSQYAKELSIHPSIISEIERGKREPSKDVLIKLALKYHVNLHWMLTGEGEPYAYPNAGVAGPLNGIVGPGLSNINDPRVRRFQALPDKDESPEAPEPVVTGPGGLVLKQGTTPFPSLKDADLSDAQTFPMTSRYIAAAQSGPPALAMKPVQPEDGAIVVARGTRLIRVEEDSEDDVYLVPFLEQKLSAGPGAEATQISDIRTKPIPSRIAYPYRSDEILSAEVRGDSMTGVGLFDGDIVYFVRTDRVADGIYVLTIAGEIFVKRLEVDRFANEIRVISENDRYQPKVITADRFEMLHVEGKVIGWVHRHPY